MLAHHRHMLVEQKLYYIAINEQLMTYIDCATLNKLCRWSTLKPKRTKMNITSCAFTASLPLFTFEHNTFLL